MTIISKKYIKATIKFLLIALLLLGLPNLIQVIWDSGKDFGYNVTKCILSLM